MPLAAVHVVPKSDEKNNVPKPPIASLYCTAAWYCPLAERLTDDHAAEGAPPALAHDAPKSDET